VKLRQATRLRPPEMAVHLGEHSPKPTYPGLFISFEGGEGAGKSTSVRSVREYLYAVGVDDVVLTREPGSGQVGQAIRELVLGAGDTGLADRAEVLLFAADRAQHVQQVVRPALQRGAVVLCDRYLDSSVAYQGHARAMGVQEVRAVSMWASDGLLPDLTVLLDLDPRVGLARAAERGQVDRIERLGLAFHTQVRDGLLAAAELEPDRFRIVDANSTPEEVSSRVLSHVKSAVAHWRRV
jgi:dTMP kinase